MSDWLSKEKLGVSLYHSEEILMHLPLLVRGKSISIPPPFFFPGEEMLSVPHNALWYLRCHCWCRIWSISESTTACTVGLWCLETFFLLNIQLSIWMLLAEKTAKCESTYTKLFSRFLYNQWIYMSILNGQHPQVFYSTLWSSFGNRLTINPKNDHAVTIRRS